VQDKHVVAMQMHGMGQGCGIGDDNANGGVGAGVVDVPFGVHGVGSIARLSEQQDGVVVVSTECRIVHCPDKVVRCVESSRNCDIDGCSWVRGGLEREIWDSAGQGIICADRCRSRLGGGFGRRAGVGLRIVYGCQCERLAGERASCCNGDIGAHPYRISVFPIGRNENISTLTNSQCHDFGGIRNDGDKIVGDHGKVMVVDREKLNTLSTGIDESQTSIGKSRQSMYLVRWCDQLRTYR
jgi:hypothetical protein